jgi:hypothetical protein
MMRLDSMFERMRTDGTLREFNARYKSGRAAAKAQGRGFMSYSAATLRLKKALIPALTSGQPVAGVFSQVFG